MKTIYIKSSKVKAEHFFYKYERYLFFILVVINSLPILQYDYFPSLDGPAHGYNVQILKSLLSDSNGFYSDFFRINPEMVPNWLGHAFLALLSTVFSMATSEKIMQFLIVAALPIVFRRLIKTIEPKSIALSYLIFSFSYSNIFLLGFYNFSIALIFLFIVLNFVLRNNDSLTNVKPTILLTILLILTYFSHALIFLIVIMLIGVFVLFQLIEKIRNEKTGLKETIKLMLNKLTWFLIISGIPLVYFGFYQSKRSSDIFSFDYLPIDELMSWFYNFNHLMSYFYEEDKEFSSSLAFVFFIIVTCIALIYFYKLISRKVKFKIDFTFVAFLLILCLLFLLPNNTSDGGIISIRIFMLTLLFLIVTISKVRVSPLLIFPFVIWFLSINQNFLDTRKDTWISLSETASIMNEIGEKIEENSVVLPMNFSNNWLLGHYNNYLGWEKDMLLLENYEAMQNYFPTQMYRGKKIPAYYIPSDSDEITLSHECYNWICGSGKSKKIDYILLQGSIADSSENCSSKLIQALQKNYKEVFNKQNNTLFKLQNN